MLLDYVHKWQPFRIDALVIVALLGASEMDEALGGLVRYRYLEYLPLLGAFVIAGNDIVKPIPGFTLYNVSDGIQATDVAGSVVGSIARTLHGIHHLYISLQFNAGDIHVLLKKYALPCSVSSL